MNKRRIIIAMVVFILLAAFAGIAALWPQGDDASRYRTAKVERGTISQAVTANGTLNPVQIVNVGSQASGQISALYVKLNDEVKKDQLLAEIDPKLSESALKQSRANLESARTAFEQAARDLERTKALVAKDYVAKVELERAQQSYLSARNSYDSQKASVERDELTLKYTRITSPIDGVVIGQDITLGQTVAASFQTPNMFKIAGSLTEMKIDVNLPEADIGKVKKDMPVTFTVDAFPDKTFEGVVTTVNLNPTAEQGIVTYLVTVTVQNPDKVLFPGMTAYVNITLTEKKDVLKVPAAALRFSPPKEVQSGIRRLLTLGAGGRRREEASEEQTIYLLKGGEPQRVVVKTGAMDDTHIEIISDEVKEGDEVIISLNLARTG